MKKVLIKSVSLFVCILLVITSIPLSAFADGGIAVPAPFNLAEQKDEYGENILTWDCDLYNGASAEHYNIYKSSDGQNYTLFDTAYSNEYYLSSEKGNFNYYVTATYEYYDEYDNYFTVESSASNAVNVISYESYCVWAYGYYDSKSSSIKIDWSDYNYANAVDGYKIFIKKLGEEYKCVADVTADKDYSYSYKVDSSPEKYYITVVSYSVINGIEYYDFDSSNEDYVEIYMPAPTLTTKTKSEKISWHKYSGFDRYEIWQYSKKGEKCIASVSASKNSYTVKGVDNYKNDYSYYIKAYKGKEYISSDSSFSSDGEARFRGAKKLKKKKTKVNVINTRKKKNSIAWTCSLTKKDKKTLQKFAKKHFKKGWSNMQKAQYTLEWINQNVHYAKGSDYNKIASRSYVDAIFNKKAGQCLQYNGAYAMMLTYLGFEARIIQGWRGTPKNKWSHYWCEMKIDGKWYLMETGNNEDSGGWMHFCQTYRNAGGYMLNGKAAK